jgi:hypothetical protein
MAFDCCEVLVLALERQPASEIGLRMETAINFRTGDTRNAVVIRFRRASKKDTGKYGYGKPHAGATFAPIEFCPFCGTKGFGQ